MSTGTPPAMRIDRFLWFARLCKSRSVAQSLAERGILRLNGRRVDRAHSPVRAGDIVTVPHGPGARVLRIVRLPDRRGPASEAQACYEMLTVGISASEPPSAA